MIPLSVALLAGFGAAVPSSRGQDQESANTQKPPSPDEIVERLGTRLNLSDDQKAQIEPIIAERQQSLQALHSGTSMRPMQKKRKMNAIFSESDRKINAILNDQQRQQYAQIEKQIREQIKERMKSRESSK